MEFNFDLPEYGHLIKKTKDLLYYITANGDNAINLHSSAIIGFMDEVSQSPELSEKWSNEEGYDSLFLLLNNFLEANNEEKPSITNDCVKEFLGRYISLFNSSISDYWLIIPIENAKFENVIKFGDYCFIPEEKPREEKIKILANLSSISLGEMTHHAEHTEKSRSPSFYKYTLLCHKIRHQNSWVNINGSRILQLDIAFLRALETELGKSYGIRYQSINELSRESNHQILVLCESSSNWGHIPIDFDENTTVLSGNLDWLNDRELQRRFLELNNLLGYNKEIDRLGFRFRRAFIFFSKSIDIHLRNRRTNEGFALELLQLMIAAESLLLDREAEKRLRLATFLSRLVEIEGKTSEQIFTAINDIYNWRSDYVHSGQDVFPEYDENFNEGETLQKISLVKQSISNFILSAPKWISLTDSKDITRKQSYADERFRENAWFKFLDDTWKSILSGSFVKE